MSSPLNFFNIVVFPALSSPRISKRISFSRSFVFLIIFKSPIKFYKRNIFIRQVWNQLTLLAYFVLPSLIHSHHKVGESLSFLLSDSMVPKWFKFILFLPLTNYLNNSKYAISSPTKPQMNLISIHVHHLVHPK